MNYIVEFSGEHPTLPLEEFRNSANITGEQFEMISFHGRVVILGSNDLRQTFDRTGLIHTISRECAPSFGSNESMEQLEDRGSAINQWIRDHEPEKRTYRLTLKKIAGTHKEMDINTIIQSLAKHIDLETDLENPDIEIMIYITPTLHFGVLVSRKERSEFNTRHVKYRPFFSPISLHPLLARTLINMSRTPAGSTLLDPFCGTGGILLEGSRLGYRMIGADLDPGMLSGAKQNLDHFNESAHLFPSDIGELNKNLELQGISEVSGIVTDMPYARSSTTFGEDMISLTGRSMKAIRDVLQPGMHAAIIRSTLEGIDMRMKSLRLISCHRFRVHKSLTRYFLLLKRY